jgi:hypothetical protein
MTKKDITILLAPSVMFVTIGVVAILVSGLIHRRIVSGDGQQKMDAFTQKVQSGEWRLTTDRWLELVHRQQATAAAYVKTDEDFRDLMLWVALTALLGIVSQVVTILHVRKGLTKK